MGEEPLQHQPEAGWAAQCWG